MKLPFSMLALTLMLTACSHHQSNTQLSGLAENAQYDKARTLNNFDDYVQFLKRKAVGQGVSAQTLNAQTNIRYIAKAVALDQQQAGRVKKRDPSQPPVANPQGTTNYLNKILTQAKVNKALDEYWQVQPQLTKASKKYAVQPEYLMALWGMESGFGYYQGNFDVLSVLATLAFDGRREKLFSKEFINAMKMLDQHTIQRHKMLGSWAGAMGQTQFMPSAYLNYAADGDGDNQKDIWKNPNDVFASIANYLHTVGWNDRLPWGVEVSLTQPLDLSLSGIESNKKHHFAFWQSQGVTLRSQTPQELQKLNALANADLWLVRPDREMGRAFLVSNNFRTLLDWNKSNYFAVSIGMFADRIQQQLGLSQ